MLLITRQVDFYSSAKAVCEAFIWQQTQSCPELHKKLWILRCYLNLINTKTQKCAPLLNFLGVPYLQHSTCTRVTWVLELSRLFIFTWEVEFEGYSLHESPYHQNIKIRTLLTLRWSMQRHTSQQWYWYTINVSLNLFCELKSNTVDHANYWEFCKSKHHLQSSFLVA